MGSVGVRGGSLKMVEAIVCGAGPAGLAAAACLKRAGIPTTVLERGESVGTSWRRRYDGLRLNTWGVMSTLPGYRAARRRYGEFPSRDDWVRYLEDYTRHHALDVRFEVGVECVERAGGGWLVDTTDGPHEARFVVMATGFDHEPKLPDWPGRDAFEGTLLHAAEFRSTEPFRGRDVLIVGPGNTGSEIAAFLVDDGAARVRASMRTPPNIFTRKWLGVPMTISALAVDIAPPRLADTMGRLTQRMIFGDLSKHGLPFPPLGVRRSVEERHIAPAIDDGFVKAVKEGRVELLPEIDRFEGRDVVLVDGERIQPDAVICATGYHRGLEPLVGHLGVVDDDGLPRGSPTIEVPTAPNLFFVGYWSKVSGQIRQMRFEARRVARTAKHRTTKHQKAAPRKGVQAAASSGAGDGGRLSAE
jgi:putative flavoprotein involved in K+ transport